MQYFIKHLFLSLILYPLCFNINGQVTGIIIINRGATVTNMRTVKLAILSKTASEMLISNDGSFVGNQWEAYKASKLEWKLRSGDGIKTVYAKFRNTGGIISEVAQANIELDTQSPTDIDFSINGGKPYTNNKKRLVLLHFEAKDVYKMRVSQNVNFYHAPWTAFSVSRKWLLTGSEGAKKIFVQYSDAAGNLSPVLEREIILDYVPPRQCKISINQGNLYTNTSKVNLTLNAEGASEMIIKGWSEWEEYSPQLKYELKSPDGLKRVYIKFGDQAGNVSNVVYDDIILDTKPPSDIIVEIDNGATYINDYRKSQIYILCQGADYMMLSNYPDFKGAYWEKYKSLVPEWPLLKGEGKRTVYVQLKDEAENLSDVHSDDITIDNKPPKNIGIKITSEHSVYDKETQMTYLNHNTQDVDLTIEGEDIAYMLISNEQKFFGATWQSYTPVIKNWKLKVGENGVKRIFIKARDLAGNQTKVFFDQATIDKEPPLDCKININSHTEFCTDKERKVTLALFARGAKYMMISNDPNFENASWIKYNHELEWQLTEQEGLKTVFAQFKDVAENVSNIVEDNIILDIKPPFDTKIVLNKGEKVTNHFDRVVLVKLRAKDAKLMRISNSSKFETSRWMAYSELNFNWQLPNQDGKHEVYVQFRDDAGNISEPVSTSISLDRTPPVYPSMVINEGQKTTNNKIKEVTLTLKAEQAQQMRIGNNYTLEGSKWVPFQNTYKWTLPGNDGLKIIYGQFRDSIGNLSRVIFDKIGIDRRAPANGRIVIDNKNKYTSDIDGNVTLDLYAKGAAEMLISNRGDFQSAEWRPYQHSVYDWYLDASDDGTKTVYIRFRDDAENESQAIHHFIILDRQEPVSIRVSINDKAKYITNFDRKINLKIFAHSAFEMMVSNLPDFYNKEWEPYKTSKQWILLEKDGLKTVYIKFRDEAGNVSDVGEAKVILDTTPPKALKVTINNGDRLTYHTNLVLEILGEGVDSMRVANNSNFTNTSWEPYKELKQWTIDTKGGLKRVYVSFKDKAGNVSGFISDQIIFSTSN